MRNYIADSDVAGLKVPGRNVVSRILKEKFLLRHVKYDGSIARYRDPLYNDRRIWLSRLMTQLICEDVLIISIDETHFRSDTALDKRWQVKVVADNKVRHGPRGNLGVKRVRQQARERLNILAVKDEVINFGLQLLDGQVEDVDIEEIMQPGSQSNTKIIPG